jgi:hypothetical protein
MIPIEQDVLEVMDELQRENPSVSDAELALSIAEIFAVNRDEAYDFVEKFRSR